MRRPIFITAVIFSALGFVAGNVFWYLVSPLWIDRVVSEALLVPDTRVTLATGKFRDVDQVHRSTGVVTVLDVDGQTIVRFTEFKGTNGPDLYVWLVMAEGVETSSDVKASKTLSLGVLKGNIGDQKYTVPAGTDIAAYNSVVVWCKQFGVLFAVAELE